MRLQPGAPQLHEQAPGNKCYTWALGDKAAVDAAFAKAAHVTKLDIVNNRLVPNAIEPRAALASYNRADDAYTLYVDEPESARRAAADDGVRARPARAQGARHRARRRRRLRLEDLPLRRRDGDGLGVEARQPPDQVGRRAQRIVPLRRAWPRPRHARGAGARQGRQVPRDARADDGEHGRVPVHVRVVHSDDPLRDAARRPVHDAGDLVRSHRGVHNTAPVDAYRGAGRPEATYVVERIVHQAAVELDIPQDEIPPAQFHPRRFRIRRRSRSTTTSAITTQTLDAAMEMADVAGFAARKAESQKRGKLRGLGYASYIEACGLAPSNVAGALGARAGLFEAGEVRVHPTGSVTVFTGSHSHGQGHETTFAQIVAARLGVPIDNVERRARRHRPRAVRHGHVRLALARGRRHGDRQGARQDRREGPQDRRASARSGGDRHRVQGRQVQRRRHRSQQDVRRNRVDRVRAAQLSARHARAGSRTRPRSTIRRTSRIRRARTSAKWRSIPTPASWRLRRSPPATISAPSSIR